MDGDVVGSIYMDSALSKRQQSLPRHKDFFLWTKWVGLVGGEDSTELPTL